MADKQTEANEYIADEIAKRSIYGQRYAADMDKRVLVMLIDLEADLKRKVMEYDLNGVSQSAAKRRRTNELLSAAKSEIKKVYKRIYAANAAELTELAPIEARSTRDLIIRAGARVQFDLGATLPTQSVMAALTDELIISGEPLLDWWTQQEYKTFSSFARQMRLGLMAGESNSELVRRITGGGTGEDAVAGVMLPSKRGARMLVQTSVASIQNSARQATYEANSDIIDALYQLSVLDRHTTKICIARSGKVWDLETKQPIGHNYPFQVPPLHVGCRSNLLPRILGGTVAPNTDPDTWLKSKPKSFLEDLLGKKATALYLKGDITSDDLIDQSNRPLTLKELEAL